MKRFAKECIICGKEIEGRSYRYCSEACRIEGEKRNKIEREIMANAELKKKETRLRPSHSLDDTLNDLEDYNRRHNTHLTYGQYVAVRDKLI